MSPDFDCMPTNEVCDFGNAMAYTPCADEGTPILDSEQSQWRDMEKMLKSLKLHEQFKLTKSTRPTGIYDDEHLGLWFQRNESRDFDNEEISFAPGLISDLKFDIPIIGLAERIVSEKPIEDLLAYILDAEKFQNHTLSNCNNAATDILIEINDFGKISVGGIQKYQRGNQKLEVRKIAIE